MAEEFLLPGENVARRGKGKVKSPYLWSGEIVLTNFRLLFLSEDFSFYIPLDEIEDVWTEGSFLSKSLHIETDKKHYIVKISKVDAWEEKIETYVDRMDRTTHYLLGVSV